MRRMWWAWGLLGEKNAFPGDIFRDISFLRDVPCYVASWVCFYFVLQIIYALLPLQVALRQFFRLHFLVHIWYIAYFSFWAFSYCKSLVLFLDGVFFAQLCKNSYIYIVMMSATLLDNIGNKFFLRSE